MNIPPAIAAELAKQRQRDLIVAAERYRTGHRGEPSRRVDPRPPGTVSSSCGQTPPSPAGTGRPAGSTASALAE